jgi:hypothetical protein
VKNQRAPKCLIDPSNDELRATLVCLVACSPCPSLIESNPEKLWEDSLTRGWIIPIRQRPYVWIRRLPTHANDENLARRDLQRRSTRWQSPSPRRMPLRESEHQHLIFQYHCSGSSGPVLPSHHLAGPFILISNQYRF